MIKIHPIQFIMNFMAKMKRDTVDVYTAQATFFVEVSAIPLLMMLLAILRYTPITEQILIDTISSLCPDVFNPFVSDLVGELYGHSSNLLSYTAISVVWIAGKSVMALTYGLNRIYNLKESRNYFMIRIRASIYTVLLILAITFGMLINTVGQRIHHLLNNTFPQVLQYVNQFRMPVTYQNILTLVYLWLFFLGIYRFLPNRKTKFRYLFPGAAFAAVGWTVFSYIFTLYLQMSKNLNYLYGSLTTLVVVLLWMYFCMYIIFIGAEFNNYLENPEEFDLTDDLNMLK